MSRRRKEKKKKKKSRELQTERDRRLALGEQQEGSQERGLNSTVLSLFLWCCSYSERRARVCVFKLHKNQGWRLDNALSLGHIVALPSKKIRNTGIIPGLNFPSGRTISRISGAPRAYPFANANLGSLS